METGTNEVGKRLSWVRTEVLKATRGELARALFLADEMAGVKEEDCGVSEKFIQLVEEGKRPLPPKRARQIAELTRKLRERVQRQAEKEGRLLSREEQKKHPQVRAAYLLGLDDNVSDLDFALQTAEALEFLGGSAVTTIEQFLGPDYLYFHAAGDKSYLDIISKTDGETVGTITEEQAQDIQRSIDDFRQFVIFRIRGGK